MQWIDLFYWALLGGIIGFAYGWRRLSKSSNYAISAAKRDPLLSERDRKAMTGYLKGRRLGVCLIIGLCGATAGAAIWLSLYLIWLVA